MKKSNNMKAVRGQGKASTKQLTPSGEMAKKGRGRPTGKRSDPSFVQTTAYIRGETYKAVRIALIEEGHGREYSELVEELLSQWLKSRK